MRKILLFFLFISFSNYSFSQKPIFTGNVIEEGNSMKISEVIVAIEGTAFAQTTNENGAFSFRDKIPAGEHMVTLTKNGYEVGYLLINVLQDKTVTVDDFIISTTKQEKKRRKKLSKAINKTNKKNEKEKEAKIKAAKKVNEKNDKRLAQERKKLEKQNKKAARRPDKRVSDVIVRYEDVPEEVTVATISPLQIKYAGLLGVTPEEINNIALYQFIDEWMGTPYLWGGSSKEGIDCSYFTMKLFNDVNSELIERTAQKQYDSNKTDKWNGNDYLEEGDLLFFRKAGDLSDDNIVHVGVYLANGKFINATEFTGGDGQSGVRIDDLSVRYWKARLLAAGRRKNY